MEVEWYNLEEIKTNYRFPDKLDHSTNSDRNSYLTEVKLKWLTKQN